MKDPYDHLRDGYNWRNSKSLEKRFWNSPGGAGVGLIIGIIIIVIASLGGLAGCL